MLKLALIVMDKWKAPSAEIAYLVFLEKYKSGKTGSQKGLEKKLGISQSSVSERLSRAQVSESKCLVTRRQQREGGSGPVGVELDDPGGGGTQPRPDNPLGLVEIERSTGVHGQGSRILSGLAASPQACASRTKLET